MKQVKGTIKIGNNYLFVNKIDEFEILPEEFGVFLKPVNKTISFKDNNQLNNFLENLNKVIKGSQTSIDLTDKE